MTPPSSPPAGEAARPWGLAAWALSAAWLLGTLDRRWIPHDEGTLAQTAWRILLGEVPHRDFDALYTGLLGYLNAGSMALLGESLRSPRIVLLAAFLAWVPALWALARRFAAPPAAALVTLLCVALGPPSYPAAMPSWYNLFLATWGLLALVRAAEEGWPARWLVAAGGCAGVSVLFKVSGLYFLAAALFFALHAALLPGGVGEEAHAGRPSDATPGRLLPVGAALLGAALLGIVLLLVRSQAGTLRGLVHYVAPVAAAVAALLVAAARRDPSAAPGEVVRRWVLIGGGFLMAVAPFAAAFAAAGALDDLARGVFVLPAQRLERAARLPFLAAGWAAAVPVALCLIEGRAGRRSRTYLAAAAAAAGVVLLALVPRLTVFVRLWYGLTLLIPLALAGAAVALVRAPPGPRRGALAAALWTAALTSLVQFPFASPVYFLAAAPLTTLAWLGTVTVGAAEEERRGHASSQASKDAAAASPRHGRAHPLAARPVTAVLWAFVLAFMFVGPSRGRLFEPARLGDTVPIPLERARIEAQPRDAVEYGLLVETVRRHARGAYMYATPDAPEVYFLAGLRNPTRTLFEIFDPPDATARTLAALERHDVSLVVLNQRPSFSPAPPPALLAELARRYPYATRVGSFIVRWRDG